MPAAVREVLARSARRSADAACQAPPDTRSAPNTSPQPRQPAPAAMSAPLRPSLLPRCSSCARRVAASALRPWSPLQQQIRGKKKLSKLPHTIPVRLLKDVKAFGRKGTSRATPMPRLWLTPCPQAPWSRSRPAR